MTCWIFSQFASGKKISAFGMRKTFRSKNVSKIFFLQNWAEKNIVDGNLTPFICKTSQPLTWQPCCNMHPAGNFSWAVREASASRLHGAHFRPLDATVPWCVGDFRGPLTWHPWWREASASHMPDHCRNSTRPPDRIPDMFSERENTSPVLWKTWVQRSGELCMSTLCLFK